MSIAKEKVENFLNEVELFFTENNVRDEFLLSAVNHSLNLLEQQLKKGFFSGSYELLGKIRSLREKINSDILPQPLPFLAKGSQKEKELLISEAIAFNAAMEDLSTQYNFQNKVSGAGFLSDKKRFGRKRSQSWHLMTRGLGLFQCFGGATQAVVGVAGGIASFETGVGPVLAAAFSTMGVDNAVAGCSAAWTGEYQKTKVNRGFHGLGLSDTQSDVAELIANLGFFWGPTLFERGLQSSKNLYLGRKVVVGIDYSNKPALSFVKQHKNEVLRRTSHIREKKIISLKKFGADDSKRIRSIAAKNIREARKILISAKVPRKSRNEIIRSFDLETFRVVRTPISEIMFRTFGDKGSYLEGRYATRSILPNQTDRIIKLALPENSATRLGEVGVPKFSVVFEGKIAPQTNLTSGLRGGENQVFLTGPLEKYSFKEVLMPRAVESVKLKMR